MSCRKWQIQIVRQQEGCLDPESAAALLRHLETCSHCRITADKFAEIDRFLLESPNHPVPPFLNERIISAVVDEMRQDSWKGAFGHFFAFFAYFRPILAGIILAVGIGLGVSMGLNLFHSINTISSASGSSYDVLAFSGIEGGERNSNLDFIWTDTSGGGR
jgi:hypothetical protein